jgi:PAB1-binding protein PBP1
LIDAYGQYSDALEELLATVFDIQKDLKEILKEQSRLIPNSSKKPVKSKSKKK